MANGRRSRFARLDGVRTRYTESGGDGPAILAPHGAPSLDRGIEALLPDVPFNWIKNARHQAQTDQPEIVAEILDAPISKKRPGRSPAFFATS